MSEEYQSDLASLKECERRLAAHIDGLYKRVDRLECLDDEQRSELYTILQALRHDTQSSGELLDTLSARPGQEAADAR